jgi:pilus assembly protein Flp/PilA
MRNLAMSFLKDDSGTTPVEYCFVAAGIAVAIIAAVNMLGGAMYQTYANADGAANNP